MKGLAEGKCGEGKCGGGWKTDAKQDGCTGQGPAARNSGKSPFPGVTSGNVADQENPRRQRNQNYTPKPQPRESGVHSYH